MVENSIITYLWANVRDVWVTQILPLKSVQFIWVHLIDLNEPHLLPPIFGDTHAQLADYNSYAYAYARGLLWTVASSFFFLSLLSCAGQKSFAIFSKHRTERDFAANQMMKRLSWDVSFKRCSVHSQLPPPLTVTALGKPISVGSNLLSHLCMFLHDILSLVHCMAM